mgnify:CR=1 FL=1|jgi:hypothetical protein
MDQNVFVVQQRSGGISAAKILKPNVEGVDTDTLEDL